MYASIGHGIVPVSIVFIAAVFIAAVLVATLVLYRTGLVRVGLLLGILALAIAVLNLFSDFAYVTNSETAGVSAEAEWVVAFVMMTALVLVYASILWILASAYGGRR